jgi:transcriptional regulator with XRE-family HTH domain
MTQIQTIKLGNKEYVVVPRAEYLKLQELAGVLAGSVDAVVYARASMGETLKQAREQAQLTQAALAAQLKKSQAMVSGAESGSISVSERYVSAVLKACGLPQDWTGLRERAPVTSRELSLLRRAEGLSGTKRKKTASKRKESAAPARRARGKKRH